MPSSIFNFDPWRSALALPRTTKLRMAVLLVAFAATYAACLATLRGIFGGTRPETSRSLAVKALGPSTEVVFLGNSVVEAAVDSTRYRRPVMALPMANGNYEVDAMILDRHLPNLTGLKAVVLQVDVMCLGWDRLGITLDFSAFHELGIPLHQTPRPWWWKARQALIEHPAIYPMFFGERLTPRQLLWGSRYEGRQARPEPGYARLVGVLTEEARAAYLGNPVPPEPRVESVVQRNREAFSRMCATLRARGVKPLLLRYPTRGGYAFFRDPTWDRTLEAFLADLPTLAGGAVPLLDLSADARFTTPDFRDTVHLNQSGAGKLAAVVDDWLRQVLSDPTAPQPGSAP